MLKRNLWIIALVILPMLACRFSAADPTATPRVVIDPGVEQETEEPTPPPIEEPAEITETEETAAPSGQEG